MKMFMSNIFTRAFIYKAIPCIWWSLTGALWLLFGVMEMTSIVCPCIGILLIVCGMICFCNKKVLSVISQILLMLYSIGFIVFTFMLIAVGSPEKWFAAVLSIIALLNVVLCIVNGYKLFAK